MLQIDVEKITPRQREGQRGKHNGPREPTAIKKWQGGRIHLPKKQRRNDTRNQIRIHKKSRPLHKLFPSTLPPSSLIANRSLHSISSAINSHSTLAPRITHISRFSATVIRTTRRAIIHTATSPIITCTAVDIRRRVVNGCLSSRLLVSTSGGGCSGSGSGSGWFGC
jgi:hypothetical protein